MTTKETFSEQYYTELIERASSALKLPYQIIRTQYADYPLCLMDYIEKGELDKSIEIRFDNEEATLTCCFDENNLCNFSLLFLDSDNAMDQFIGYVTKNYKYNFKRSMWTHPDCYLKLKKIGVVGKEFCMMFGQ